jgi:hypothetical protein
MADTIGQAVAVLQAPLEEPEAGEHGGEFLVVEMDGHVSGSMWRTVRVRGKLLASTVHPRTLNMATMKRLAPARYHRGTVR